MTDYGTNGTDRLLGLSTFLSLNGPATIAERFRLCVPFWACSLFALNCARATLAAHVQRSVTNDAKWRVPTILSYECEPIDTDRMIAAVVDECVLQRSKNSGAKSRANPRPSASYEI